MPVSVALCSFEGPPEDGFSPFSGGFGEGETPLTIPNRAVKPLSADGTWPSRAWESRTPPVSSARAAPGRLVLVNPAETKFAQRIDEVDPRRLVVVNDAYDPLRARPD